MTDEVVGAMVAAIHALADADPSDDPTWVKDARARALVLAPVLADLGRVRERLRPAVRPWRRRAWWRR